MKAAPLFHTASSLYQVPLVGAVPLTVQVRVRVEEARWYNEAVEVVIAERGVSVWGNYGFQKQIKLYGLALCVLKQHIKVVYSDSHMQLGRVSAHALV